MNKVLQEYVLVWCEGSDPNSALLILKDKPDWQKGRLNLPGGKIEAGESPGQAARREIKEETGYDTVTEPVVVGKMVDQKYIIWILTTVISSDNSPPKGRPEETETPQWIKWNEACKDKRLLPNLRVIIPLCMSGVTDFIIEDTYIGRDNDHHSFKIAIVD